MPNEELFTYEERCRLCQLCVAQMACDKHEGRPADKSLLVIFGKLYGGRETVLVVRREGG